MIKRAMEDVSRETKNSYNLMKTETKHQNPRAVSRVFVRSKYTATDTQRERGKIYPESII